MGETKNSRTGQTFQKFGVYVNAFCGSNVKLGQPMDTKEWAQSAFRLDGSTCDERGNIFVGPDMEQGEYVLHKPGQIAICDFAECLKKIAGVEVTNADLHALSDAVGENPTPIDVHAWLQSVLTEDSMRDSFAELHPQADARFTCWDQYRNKRFENCGTRIDYILVDSPLFSAHGSRGPLLDCGSSFADPNSETAALAAATLGGRYEPSGFAGGGLPPLEEDEYKLHFRPPSTGILYTPPQLSDHIGVSLLLQGLSIIDATQARDAATLLCQPHKKGRRITDFFGTKRAAPGLADEQEQAKRLAQTKGA